MYTRHTALLLLALACSGKDDVDSTDDTTDTEIDTDALADTNDTVTDTEDTVADTDSTDTDDSDAGDTDAAASDCIVVGAMSPATTRQPQTLTVQDTNGADLTSQVTTWSSSDESIAALWVAGVLQPVTAGDVTVTAELPGDVSCTADVSFTLAAAEAGDLVFNELLADVDGDPNGDGTSSAVDDEFVEILNVGTATVALGGVTLVEDDFPALPRHTFADDALLRPGEAVVVFAGGDTSSLSANAATFEVAQNADPGISFGLNLNDAGDRVRLIDAAGVELAEVAYGDADSTGSIPSPLGVSITRVPDGTGAFVVHPIVVHTPGVKSDGSSFDGYDQVFQDLHAP